MSTSTETLPKVTASTQLPGKVFGGVSRPKPIALYHLHDMRYIPPGGVVTAGNGDAKKDYVLQDNKYYIPPEGFEPPDDYAPPEGMVTGQAQLRIIEEEFARLRSGPIGNHIVNIPEGLVPETQTETPEAREPTLEELGQLTFDIEVDNIDESKKTIKLPLFLGLRKRIAERKASKHEHEEEEKDEAQLRREKVARFVGMSVFQGYNYLNPKTSVAAPDGNNVHKGTESRPLGPSEIKLAIKVQDLVTKRKSLMTHLGGMPDPKASAQPSTQELKHAANMKQRRESIQSALEEVDSKLAELFGLSDEQEVDQAFLDLQREKIAALEEAQQAKQERKQLRAEKTKQVAAKLGEGTLRMFTAYGKMSYDRMMIPSTSVKIAVRAAIEQWGKLQQRNQSEQQNDQEDEEKE